MTENTRPEDLNGENSLNTPKKGETTMSSGEKEQKRISRREFVKGAAVGAAGVAAAGVLASCAQEATPCPPAPTAVPCPPAPTAAPCPVPWLPEKWDYEADVVVVGWGGAGSAASIVAHDEGAKVLLLEKMPEGKEGGSTRVSGNVWAYYDDINKSLEYRRASCGELPVPEDILQTWAEETSKNDEWIKSLGAEIGFMPVPVHFPEYPGSDSYKGYHHVMPGWGMGRIHEVFKTAIEKRGIEVMYETPGKKLIQDAKTKEILGVVAEKAGTEVYIKAKKAVVLTCGGFEGNQQMIRDYLMLPKAYPWGTPGSTGDGIRMAQEVGADLWHMRNYMGIAGMKVPEYDCGFYVSPAGNGWINVALDGKRFANEKIASDHGKAMIHGRYELYPDRPYFTVFDETARLAGPLNLPLEYTPFGWNLEVLAYKWSQDNSVEIAKGWIKKADTVSELATGIGLDSAALEKTVSDYNSYCKAGVDSEFGRDPKTLVPLETPPYYAYEWGPLLVYTCGGPRRNKSSQVLNSDGVPIPRLYTAGEMSSTYSRCMDGGDMIADTLAFGRIAGKNAAAEKPWA